MSSIPFKYLSLIVLAALLMGCQPALTPGKDIPVEEPTPKHYPDKGLGTLYIDTPNKASVKSRSTYIDGAKAKFIHDSALRNCEQWPIGDYVNNDDTLPYDEAIARMKHAFRFRLNWINNAINAM